MGPFAWRSRIPKTLRGKAAVKRYWEIIADNPSKKGWSWGCVSAVTSEGRIIWVADAHRDDGKRFVVHADDKFTAFLELERAISRSEERRVGKEGRFRVEMCV